MKKYILIALSLALVSGAVLAQPVIATGEYGKYKCNDGTYDPYEPVEPPSTPEAGYENAMGHKIGKCKDGSDPVLKSSEGPSTSKCSSSFLGFPAWYRGLVDETSSDCSIKQPDKGAEGLGSYIWKIVLNVIEIAMMLVAYLSVIFIIYGGVMYIISAGSADGVKKAKSSITNAIIGLVISILAIAVVEFVFSKLTTGM